MKKDRPNPKQPKTGTSNQRKNPSPFMATTDQLWMTTRRCSFGVMCNLTLILATAVLALSARAETPVPVVRQRPHTITTYAGGPGKGLATSFGQDPFWLAVKGNFIYVSDGTNSVIRAFNTSSGKETVLAGNLTFGFSGDGGPATKAALGNSGVAVDRAGNIYIAENSSEGGSRIRKVDTAGIITTVAGNGISGYSGDGGPATEAQLNDPRDVTVDGAGNLYIADTFNNVIRKVNASGIISTLVTLANNPNGVALDRAGNLYITVRAPSEVFKFDTTSGVLTPFAGNGTFGFSGDGGPATSAQLFLPYDVGVDSVGNVYIADVNNSRIRKVDTSGIITTVAGNGEFDYNGDGGPATQAALNGPTNVVVDSAGNLYIADDSNFRLRKVDTSGIITTVAGNGNPYSGPDGGPPAQSVEIGLVEGLATPADGNVYFTDVSVSTIRKVTPSGVVTTVAGNGTDGFSGDGGPATSAQLSTARDVAFNRAGNLYIADTDNNRIRKVDKSGIITTVAGNGIAGFSGDGGLATLAQLNFPRAVEFDSRGNLYIGDDLNSVVRKVTPKGIITTVAGIGGVPGNSGDGGQATSALLSSPIGLVFDATGNLYIADYNNSNVRKVDVFGVITTVAGTGVYGFSGDGGPAIEAELSRPIGLEADSRGNLYIADIENNRVRKVNAAGIISTVAGGGGVADSVEPGFSGDGGPAKLSLLNVPIGLALDASDNLYIGDFNNQRIRRVEGSLHP